MTDTKPPTVHVTFIVDRSGSMESLRSDVIGGFNAFIADQKAQPGKCRLTLHQFDGGGFDTLHDARNIGEVPNVGTGDFVPRGSTPLYDAVGRAITNATIRLEARRAANKRAEKQIVVILTDGQENASSEYTREKVFELITAKEAEGWVFTYLGANQDAYAVGGGMGIAMAATSGYKGDSAGMGAVMDMVSHAVSSTRTRTLAGVNVSSASLYAETGKTAEDDLQRRS